MLFIFKKEWKEFYYFVFVFRLRVQTFFSIEITSLFTRKTFFLFNQNLIFVRWLILCNTVTFIFSVESKNVKNRAQRNGRTKIQVRKKEISSHICDLGQFVHQNPILKHLYKLLAPSQQPFIAYLNSLTFYTFLLEEFFFSFVFSVQELQNVPMPILSTP